jgi:hypothetical protein
MQRGPKPTGLSPAQTAAVCSVLKTLGLPNTPSDFDTIVSDDGFNCIVTIRMSALRLLGLPGIIPGTISLSATAGAPWSIGHPRFCIVMATSIGQIFCPAYPPPSPGPPPGAPPMTRDDPSKMNGGFPAGIYVFNQGSIPATGYQQWNVNYGGYGVGAASGTPTDTGSNLCSFFPYQGAAPMAPPPDSAYPSP